MSLGHPDGYEVIEYADYDTDIPIAVDDQGLWISGDLPDNVTGSWGPFYRIEQPTPEGKWKLSLGWAREVEPPWRRGGGIAVRRGPVTVSYGVWFRGPAPTGEILEEDSASVRKIKRFKGRARM